LAKRNRRSQQQNCPGQLVRFHIGKLFDFGQLASAM